MSYMGLIGSIATLLTLDLDNFGLIHFSHFSYLTGHYMLVFNSLHIMRESDESIDFKKGSLFVIFLNVGIQLVNIIIPKANYGELARMPKIFPFVIEQPFYFVLVTSVYILIFLVGKTVHQMFIAKKNYGSIGEYSV